MLAFRLMRCAMRGDLIWLKSMPPGVYVNGFLSFVIMAFCTQDGISGGCCVCRRRVGIEPFISGGGGGAELECARNEQKCYDTFGAKTNCNHNNPTCESYKAVSLP